MGTIFEELVRRFNEENNEEAGEHWTPRDAVKLMANLIFLPDRRRDRVGHLPALRRRLRHRRHADRRRRYAAASSPRTHGKEVSTHLYGQEINAETYAICKADLLLKGEGEAADNIVGGPEYSTLSNDAFPLARVRLHALAIRRTARAGRPTSSAWAARAGINDPRFIVDHAGDPEFSLITRSSDGQMLFLANMVSKMKHDTPLGSRIAEVHNGSSLFTGDAGQGESNIRRWIIENDWLEAIVALPLNMFYNTGIATYIWVLTNRKPEHRQGKVQLIDATQWFQPLRKNLGKKNCELSDDDIAAHLRDVPRLRGDRGVEDLRQRRLRLPEGASSAASLERDPAQPARGSSIDAAKRSRASHRRKRGCKGPAPTSTCRISDRGAVKDGATSITANCKKRQGELAADRTPRPVVTTASVSNTRRSRSAARPFRRRDERGRVRAGHRSARHRASAAARGRRHRSVPRARGAAYAADAWYRWREREDRLRDQLHALLLQAAAAAIAGRNQSGHSRAGTGNRGSAGEIVGEARHDRRRVTPYRRDSYA